MLETDSAAARDRLTAALGVRRWVGEVADGGPYASLDELLAAVEATGASLTDTELDEAVGHHPRIGERAEGDGTAQRLSAAEQAGIERGDEGVDAALARGNAVYESRFGRVFLIRAVGRSREETLAELQRRLKNDLPDEVVEAKQQLREIAAVRVRRLFGGES